jgi:hypothetical protein
MHSAPLPEARTQQLVANIFAANPATNTAVAVLPAYSRSARISIGKPIGNSLGGQGTFTFPFNDEVQR